jgi:hypothetical protein
MNGQYPLYSLAEAIPQLLYIKFYNWVNTHGNYADGLYNSMLDDKDGHIPSPLIIFTCTASGHALLEWQMNKGVHANAFKSNLQADLPNHSNYFNHNINSGKNSSWCAATGGKLKTSPGIAEMYTFLINTWNTLPESYQQRECSNTLATVQRDFQ